MSPRLPEGLGRDEKGITRCWWCGDDPLYVKYHDTEWGKPIRDDIRLFEKICLEGFQAGLSWITILRKRENFRDAFHGFEFERIATYTKRDVNRLLKNEGIIRHRGKIEATINNAQRMLELIDERSSLAAYVWSYEIDVSTRPKTISKKTIPGTTPESVALSKDLKKRGWKFVGPTTVYAFMQAMGLVNDHISGCSAGEKVEKLRTKFRRPRS
ncbi:MAG: DNA-3-methyladenine glycosylase I [Planctomycetota bacterium]|nr:DNA-3-methyladenine glycosylase I [Planctomycetota bacterium]